jgi:hypothetical protein
MPIFLDTHPTNRLLTPTLRVTLSRRILVAPLELLKSKNEGVAACLLAAARERSCKIRL